MPNLQLHEVTSEQREGMDVQKLITFLGCKWAETLVGSIHELTKAEAKKYQESSAICNLAELLAIWGDCFEHA